MGNRPRCEILIQGDGESTKNFKERLNMFLDEICTVDFSTVESVTSSMNDSRLVTTVLYVSTNEVMAPQPCTDPTMGIDPNGLIPVPQEKPQPCTDPLIPVSQEKPSKFQQKLKEVMNKNKRS